MLWILISIQRISSVIIPYIVSYFYTLIHSIFLIQCHFIYLYLLYFAACECGCNQGWWARSGSAAGEIRLDPGCSGAMSSQYLGCYALPATLLGRGTSWSWWVYLWTNIIIRVCYTYACQFRHLRNLFHKHLVQWSYVTNSYAYQVFSYAWFKLYCPH